MCISLLYIPGCELFHHIMNYLPEGIWYVLRNYIRKFESLLHLIFALSLSVHIKIQTSLSHFFNS